ncbi:unnamed protein product [Heligmosomoides polygyrus]|uniref:DOMON domain-containing protein n=1 Tax=Heligmosomoides polygyrus TaxID=6339 RepID=A0A183FME9_HELPZ|nr:unnamed protein product [Heligmosomoides polygyrus]
MSGYMAGRIWLSDSEKFSLTWNGNSSRISYCYKQLGVTDQGYAVQVSPRIPRHAPDRVGLVKSNQLSAQLLAAEGRSSLRPSPCFGMLCFPCALVRIPLLWPLLPPFGQDIAATHLGGGYVQVRRCVPIPPASFHLVSFNDTCYSMPKRITVGSFLNLDTGVIVNSADVRDCSALMDFYLHSDKHLPRFSPFSSSLTQVFSSSTLNISVFKPTQPLLAPQLTIFHNLILINFSETSKDQQLHGLWVTMDHERVL